MSRLHCLMVLSLALPGAALAQEGGGVPISDVLREARADAPSIEVAQRELESAEHSVGNAVSLHMPRVSVSERQTYRYNNPEKYSYSYNFEEGGQCFDAAGNPCLPVVVIDGTVTAPESRWSNSLSFTGIQPVIAPREVVAIRQAQGRVDGAELKLKSQEEQLILDLVGAYLGLQAGLGQMDVYAQSLSLNEELEANLVVRVDTGQSAPLDLERSRLDVEESKARLRQAAREAAEAEASAARRSQVRTVDRSERIRTYNFPENRIADHRTGFKAYNLDLVLGGELDPVIQSCVDADEAERLAAAQGAGE